MIVPKWPQPIVARPSVQSLVKLYAPRPLLPEAVDPAIVKKYEENLLALKESAASLADASEKVSKLAGEKAGLEAKGAGVNRWSNKNSTLAQQHRIQKDIEGYEATKAKAQLLHDALVDAGKALYAVIRQYEDNLASYNKYVKTFDDLLSFPSLYETAKEDWA
jgi:hypothetical protein